MTISAEVSARAADRPVEPRGAAVANPTDLRYGRSDAAGGDRAPAALAAAGSLVAPEAGRGGRYSERPLDWRARMFGLGGTMSVAGAILGGLVVSWQVVQVAVAPSRPLVVSLEPLAAPPEPTEEVPEGPRQTEQKQQKVEWEERPEPPEILIPQRAVPQLPVQPPAAPAAKPADPIPETTAPKTMPAPPAQRASSNAEVTWESLLLAHLEKYRRYPAAARGRRVEGVAFVTFRMNRAGRVLSVAIARSSGSALLDRAAVETLRRAQPLPRIPVDKASELELSVPVEFFLQR